MEVKSRRWVMSQIFNKEVLEFFECIIDVLGKCKINYVHSIDFKEAQEQYNKAKEILERWKKQDYR